MILLLFGPPGCGKGTQAALVAEHFRIPAISTGEMFRAECSAGTELGRTASAILARGGLIDDDIVNRMVARRIAQPDCSGGFLLDGYPRTVSQAKELSALLQRRGLPQPLVLHLDVPDEQLVGRLTARRQCPHCRRIYNIRSQPPRVETRCDDDGEPLITRADDTEPVIRERLAAYHRLTDPILQWYGRDAVRRIDGSASCEAVSRAVAAVLEESLAHCMA